MLFPYNQVSLRWEVFVIQDPARGKKETFKGSGGGCFSELRKTTY